MTKLKSVKFIISGLILLALLVGIITIPILAKSPASDEIQYNRLAMSLIENQKYIIIDDLLISPGFPAFLTITYGILGNNYYAVYILQFMLLGGIGALIFLIANKHLRLSRFVALLPALTVIVWPYFIVYANQILTEILFTFLFTLSVYLLLNLFKKPDIKSSLALGATLGIATLTRPIPLLLPFWLIFFIIIAILIKKRTIRLSKEWIKKQKKYIICAMLAVFTFFIVLCPWMIYASLKMGQFTPVTSMLPATYQSANKSYLWEYNHFKTPGYEPEAAVTTKKILLVKFKNIFRFWKSGADGQQAAKLIQTHPITKYIIYFYRIIFYLLLFLSFLSLRFINKNNIVLLLWLIIAYSWALHTVLYVYPRYTLPIIPFMILLAFFSLYKQQRYYLQT